MDNRLTDPSPAADPASVALPAAAPSLISRLLHMAVAAGVTLQLLLSTVMQMPAPGRVRSTLEGLSFEMHEVLGLTMMGLILCWLLWLSLRRHEPRLGELLPWTRRAGRLALADAIRRMLSEARHGRLAPTEEIEPLVKSVHGLGLLCVLLMSGTGSLVWLGMNDAGVMTGWGRVVLDVHQFTANLMWIYLICHAGMALLHQLRGEATLKRFFSLRID